MSGFLRSFYIIGGTIMEAIVAIDKNGIIGAKNKGLLWHSKKDLQWFKQQTLNKTCVFGQTTYDTLPIKPLPNRTCVVLSRNPEQSDMHMSYDDVCNIEDKVIICGGAQVYKLFEQNIDTIWITTIDRCYNEDDPIYFPKYNWHMWDGELVKRTTDIIDGQETGLTIHKYTRRLL